ncbi:MAG TPA: hypothetical protein VGK67_24795 [Myxococcales bacterium]|jgi:hypothetical protein
MPLEAELDGLGRAVLETLRAHPEEFGTPRAAQLEAKAPNLPIPAFVLESEAGLLLGESPARSLSLAIPVYEAMEGGVWTFGPPFAEAREPRDFLQILVVQASPPASRVALSRVASLRSLAQRLPGWFAHSEDQRTTARVHRQLLAAGFSQSRLADALLAQAADEGFAGCVAVAAGVPSARALELMQPFGERLAKLKSSLVPSARTPAGVLEGCEAKDCGTCDEAVVCDKVREVLAADRAKKESR